MAATIYEYLRNYKRKEGVHMVMKLLHQAGYLLKYKGMKRYQPCLKTLAQKSELWHEIVS